MISPSSELILGDVILTVAGSKANLKPRQACQLLREGEVSATTDQDFVSVNRSWVQPVSRCSGLCHNTGRYLDTLSSAF